MNENLKQFCPVNKKDWRTWLEKNHEHEPGVWLIIFKKNADKPNLSWSEAVDEALCFGWIDGIKKPIDALKYKQYFTQRKAKSTWSRVNKNKIKQLLAAGLITKAGLKSIEVAKANGSWTALDSIENLEIPDDLAQIFKQHPDAKKYFYELSRSLRKGILYWIVVAKQQKTRSKRINEFVENARLNQLPKHFRTT